jgi:hypothetical protein
LANGETVGDGVQKYQYDDCLNAILKQKYEGQNKDEANFTNEEKVSLGVFIHEFAADESS